jgi:hypothetical protein
MNTGNIFFQKGLTVEEWEKIQEYGESDDIVLQDTDVLFDYVLAQSGSSTSINPSRPASLTL